MKQKFGYIKRGDKSLNYHRQRFRKLTFRALALRSDEGLKTSSLEANQTEGGSSYALGHRDLGQLNKCYIIL